VTHPALAISGVSVDYGSRRVLTNVNASLDTAEMVALIGPNGAGKSTLLRCVTGLLKPTTGEVAMEGRRVAEIERVDLARMIAVVPGQTVVAFPMRVHELVALGRVPHEHPLLGLRPLDRERVDFAIERVGITDLRDRDLRELSLGERQLAVLAMAIAQDARLLLLDEPTVHLDLRHQVAVMELLRDLSQRDGVTVLAVLHDIALARLFFPRLLLLDHGRLIGDGPSPDVLSDANIRVVYGVDPKLVHGGMPA
jgi:iron complex transport system ATP-binding protein